MTYFPFSFTPFFRVFKRSELIQPRHTDKLIELALHKRVNLLSVESVETNAL